AKVNVQPASRTSLGTPTYGTRKAASRDFLEGSFRFGLHAAGNEELCSYCNRYPQTPLTTSILVCLYSALRDSRTPRMLGGTVGWTTVRWTDGVVSQCGSRC